MTQPQQKPVSCGPRSLTVAALLVILFASVHCFAQVKRSPPPQRKAAPAQPTPQPQADPEADAIVKAEHALDAKDYAAAIAVLKELQERGSTNYRVYFDLGFAHTMGGEIPAAIEAYRKALELNASLPQANINLAILLMDQQRAAEAVPLLEKAVVQRPQDARSVVLLADALAATGKRGRAAEEYRNAIALDAKLAPAYLGLAHLQVAGKQFDEAIKNLRKAADLQPGNVATRLEIGGVLEAAGRPDEARAFYQDLAVKQPDNAVVHRRLAHLLLAAKKFDEAATELETATKLAPAPGDERDLAIAYARAKRAGLAIPRLKKVAAASPGDYDVRLLLGEMLLAQRQFPEAQKELEAAAALRPEIPDAWVDLANALYLQENYTATVAVLDRLARTAPETPWLDFLRAISLDKLGQALPALESYQKFLAIAGGKYPDQEFQARQRVKALQRVLEKGGGRRGR